jgi:hypothetical protein
MKGKAPAKPNTQKSSAFKGIDEFLEKASERPEDLQNQKIAADFDT